MRKHMFTPGQRGFTLIELVMAMAAGAFVMAAAGYGILQVFNMNTRNVNYMTAVRNAQNAGYWVSHDVQMAPRDFDTSPSWISISADGRNLSLVWRDWTNHASANHTCVIGWDPGSKTISRTYDSGTPASIGQHIEYVHFSREGSTENNPFPPVVFDVTVSVTTRGITGTEKRTYEVSPRPGLAQ
jgi:prepilin-type N-terminal cleavage/methylation domain-containing protein